MFCIAHWPYRSPSRGYRRTEGCWPGGWATGRRNLFTRRRLKNRGGMSMIEHTNPDVMLTKIPITLHTVLAPERVLEAARDFSDRRTKVFPAVSSRHMTVHAAG